MHKEIEWEYQMMRRVMDDGTITYGIYKFYEKNPPGNKPAWTDGPTILLGIIDVKNDILRITSDIYSRGIRDYATGELIDAIQD